ncbi:hypothetical protein J8273_7039 [Carpediemonas membranifera]|uniref:Uncharacterized protein n=1 Tax=Carpediemonas membranifera TaxID=201153 RepID=A0A8J6BUW4_9EUKA|nr:hypothetical protein J8273_7039 [Carpediemonas membranifera]|eukprot:KAG9390786.1 hypothetical protein J8273_7039 [Carpediemonas membranifera]
MNVAETPLHDEACRALCFLATEKASLGTSHCIHCLLDRRLAPSTLQALKVYSSSLHGYYSRVLETSILCLQRDDIVYDLPTCAQIFSADSAFPEEARDRVGILNREANFWKGCAAATSKEGMLGELISRFSKSPIYHDHSDVTRFSAVLVSLYTVHDSPITRTVYIPTLEVRPLALDDVTLPGTISAKKPALEVKQWTVAHLLALIDSACTWCLPVVLAEMVDDLTMTSILIDNIAFITAQPVAFKCQGLTITRRPQPTGRVKAVLLTPVEPTHFKLKSRPTGRFKAVTRHLPRGYKSKNVCLPPVFPASTLELQAVHPNFTATVNGVKWVLLARKEHGITSPAEPRRALAWPRQCGAAWQAMIDHTLTCRATVFLPNTESVGWGIYRRRKMLRDATIAMSDAPMIERVGPLALERFKGLCRGLFGKLQAADELADYVKWVMDSIRFDVDPKPFDSINLPKDLDITGSPDDLVDGIVLVTTAIARHRSMPSRVWQQVVLAYLTATFSWSTPHIQNLVRFIDTHSGSMTDRGPGLAATQLCLALASVRLHQLATITAAACYQKDAWILATACLSRLHIPLDQLVYSLIYTHFFSVYNGLTGSSLGPNVGQFYPVLSTAYTAIVPEDICGELSLELKLMEVTALHRFIQRFPTHDPAIDLVVHEIYNDYLKYKTPLTLDSQSFPLALEYWHGLIALSCWLTTELPDQETDRILDAILRYAASDTIRQVVMNIERRASAGALAHLDELIPTAMLTFSEQVSTLYRVPSSRLADYCDAIMIHSVVTLTKFGWAIVYDNARYLEKGSLDLVAQWKSARAAGVSRCGVEQYREAIVAGVGRLVLDPGTEDALVRSLLAVSSPGA